MKCKHPQEDIFNERKQ